MGNRQRQILLLGGLILAVLAAYWNHFGNGFHFDDQHAVIDNTAIRKVDLPRFFSDARTFSHEPKGQSYRPLVTASLALDYWFGGGLKPFWFHVSTFFWFVVLILLMYALYLYVLERTCPHEHNIWIAGYAAALYALHPVSAETVNYIIQRGDLYVALGIVAGLVIYARKPAWRRYGLYLLPPLAAMFAKPPAIVFALFLVAYIILIERASWLGAIPALAMSAVFLCLEKAMTPPTFFSSTMKSWDYWITQPYVTLRYVRSFFVPLYLNIDTDLPAFHNLASPLVWIGFTFCAVLVAAAVLAARQAQWRAVSLGLWWFLIGLIPTAIYPLNEVENDHRMFLPFVGLILAVVSAAALALRGHAPLWRVTTAGAVVLLIAFAWGTHKRNEVWRTDETLWRDDIAKSPNNPRGHDQLGAALSNAGRFPEAMQEFDVALRLEPDFANVYLNRGKIFAKLPGRVSEAIQAFHEAIRLDPTLADAHLNLGGILAKMPDRLPEAIQESEAALRIAPDFVQANYNLGMALTQIPGRLPEAILQYQTAVRFNPDYSDAHRNLGLLLSQSSDRLPEAVHEFEEALRTASDPAEAHMNLGVAYSRMPGKLNEAIAQYEIVLRIRPDYPEAQTNLQRALAAVQGKSPRTLADLEAAVRTTPGSVEAHYELGVALAKTRGRLQEAIAQYQAALQINPSFADAHTQMGIALSGIPDRLPEAISELKAALKLQPDSADAHSNLGLALSRAPGRMPEAIVEFEAAYRIRPDPLVGQTLDNLRANRGN